MASPDLLIPPLTESHLRLAHFQGAWVAQSVEHPTLDFGSGHDLVVRGIESHIRLCADGAEPAWDSLSPPHYCS